LFSRSLDRVGKGVRTTARDALVSDAVPKQVYGRAFGLHSAMDTAGALAGVIVAYVLVSKMPGQYRLMFLLAGIPGLISLFITLTLKDRGPAAPTDKAAVIPIMELGPAYWRAMALTVVFTFANSSDTFLLLRANNLGLDP